ncbi:hypothetical protein M5K25_017063 [Dendrobium thyrsiflorum]|uniref:C2 domain-containing protein n=1 Tax=Dendrobium thyrsiflorum TaxID=117978 RepID=A0ABD0ULA2_DENTH
MGSRYEIEVTIRSARDLKNVNWRKGDLRPYAVVWIDSSAKSSTKVDIDHDTDPVWDEKLVIPLPPNISLRDATLHIDIVHANADEGIKPLVGSARLPLSEVVDEAGIAGSSIGPSSSSAPPVAHMVSSISAFPSRRPLGYPYGGPTAPPSGYPYDRPAASAPPAGYPYGGPPAAYPYGGPPAGGPPGGNLYGGSQPAYGQVASGSGKKSKFGMGTGLAVGAAAGVLGGLALAEGVDYVEDKIEDDVEEKVEDDYYDDY